MQKSFIGLTVMASSFLAHAAAVDVIKSDSVNFSVSATRLDQPTLTVGIGSPALGVYFDFGEKKFKTNQPMGLNIGLHNPSANFGGLDVVLASVTGNDHQLKGAGHASAYDFYMGSAAGSVGTYKVPHGTSHQDPFGGLTALSSAELATANLSDFDGISGGQEININATTYISLESAAADTTLVDGTYTDNASLYVQTTWTGYEAP